MNSDLNESNETLVQGKKILEAFKVVQYWGVNVYISRVIDKIEEMPHNIYFSKGI
jgi:hypothetical protein